MDPSIVVALVLVGAAIFALEVGFSSAITEILAGVALGFLYVDIAKLGWVQFLGNLGLLGLMFLAGFEVDVHRLRRTWRASVGIGTASLAFPLCGVLLVCLFGFGLAWNTSMLLAIGLSTTSLALVYHALSERGELNADVGQIALGAATVVDVLSMIALAVLLGDAGWGTAIFLLVVLPTIFGLPRIGRWVFRRYQGSLVEFELRFLMVLLISMGFMADHIGGIHPAVVAFLVGLVMGEVVEEHGEVEKKLRPIVFSLLAPVFFLSAGMEVDLTLVSPDMLLKFLVLLVLAVSLKFAGTALATRWLVGHSSRFFGLLFNYRLAFGIVTAKVGRETGVITEAQYVIILLVIVSSALLPAFLLGDRPNEIETGGPDDGKAPPK